MADGAQFYFAVLIGEPDLPTTPGRFITASCDTDAVGRARHLFGAAAGFDLWKSEGLVLRHDPEATARPGAPRVLRTVSGD